MKRFWAVCAAIVAAGFVCTASAQVQNPGVKQSGGVTANNCVKWTGPNTVADAGAACGGGAVSSVFGRTGVVVATPGDYGVAQITGAAPLASPGFTGNPTAPTQSAADNSTLLATTAFVKALGYAPLASPAFSGNPTAPTQGASDNSTLLATTAFVKAQGYGVYTAPWTSAVAYQQSKYNSNIVFATDFMGATTCDGVTDQFANLQAFLNQVAANGAAGNAAVTGIFPPGNCFISGGSLTLTVNTNALPINYRLIGYGAAITPDPTKGLTALRVIRGTFATHGDEQRTITIEGLTINARNNANIIWGFEIADTRVALLRNNCYAGDDGGTIHNQGNFACIYYRQTVATDPNTGAFYGRIEGNTMRGLGPAGNAGAMPVGVRVDGSGGNAMVIRGNSFGSAVYGIRALNPCATVNTSCAYLGNGVSVSDNYFENILTCMDLRTSVPTLSKLESWQIGNNTFELCTQSELDISTITQQSVTPISFGPNGSTGSGAHISNPNAIAIYQDALAKAWVRFTATTGAILAAFNVSSVTRSAAGTYIVNFANAFLSANYSCQATVTASNFAGALIAVGISQTVSAYSFDTLSSAGATGDAVQNSVTCFGR